jgi:hypothetical protein
VQTYYKKSDYRIFVCRNLKFFGPDLFLPWRLKKRMSFADYRKKDGDFFLKFAVRIFTD